MSGTKKESIENDVKTFKSYTMAAIQGDPQALFNLGNCYFFGTGVTKDYSKAVEFYQLATDKGHAEAQYYLGWCYIHGLGVLKNIDTGVNHYTVAAEHGDAKSQYELGLKYCLGVHVSEDYPRGIQYLKQAADQGHEKAQFEMGEFHYNGGKTEDYPTAFKYYNLAAEQGKAAAYYKLGMMYEEGHGVAKNRETALAMYKIPADAGFSNAKSKLEALLLKQSEDQTKKSDPSKVKGSEERYEILINKKLVPLVKNYLKHLEENPTAKDVPNEKYPLVKALLDDLENKAKTPSACDRFGQFYTQLNVEALTAHRDPVWKRFVRNAVIAGGILLTGIIPGLVVLLVYVNTGNTASKSLSYWKSGGQAFFDKLKELEHDDTKDKPQVAPKSVK